MTRFLAAAVGSLLLGAVASCDAGSQDDGDCNARIEYRGVVYRPHNLLKHAHTESAKSGFGDVVGCEGEAVDQVAVHEIHGVAPGVAVAVLDPHWRGIYVLEGSSPDDWPSSIKTRAPDPVPG